MNSRILAVIALGLLATGCAQVSILPAGQPDAVPEPSPASAAESPVSEPVVDLVTTGTPEGDIAIDPPAASEVAPGTTAVVAEANATEQDMPDAADAMPPAPEALDVQVALESQEAQKVQENESLVVQSDEEARRVTALCNEIGNKLGSVSVEDCLAQPLTFAGGYTVQSRPLVVRDFHTQGRLDKETRILILGGIHGDEYSSISIMFKWMELLDASENRDFRWRFAPSVNPDGLLDGQAVRQNANGVDLNRNFPSDDWQALAEEYWKDNTKSNPRRYPGSHPASEPEVQWVVDQINSWKPDVIVSVHAPYHLLDYDGPPEAPQKIGELHLHLLGVYPGSLGNYAGINLGIPVVTMELPSAGIMPSNEQISSMWNDLLQWLYEHHET